MSNNVSVSSGATTFQKKMMINKQKMREFDALRKVTNNMIREQNSRITALVDRLKDINAGKDTPDIKLSKLMKEYVNTQKELAYFDGYNQEIQKDKNSTKFSVTLIEGLDEIRKELSKIKSEIMQTTIVESISSLVSNVVPSLTDMKMHISGLVNTFNKDSSIMQTKSYKSELDEYKNKKNIIDNGLVQINKWLEQCEVDGHTDQINNLRKYKYQLKITQNGINESGLSYLMGKEMEAKLQSEGGLMQTADKCLEDMNELGKILDSNLQKYNAEPNKFGANYRFSGDTGKFRVINPANPLSNVGFYSSQHHFDEIIETFTQECAALEKIERFDSVEKRQILEMKDKLLTKKVQLNVEIASYKQRVNELKHQSPANIIEDANNKTAENLANVMAERHEKDLVSSTGNARHTDGAQLAIIPVEMNG
nr:hypothetical protein [uncultured Moellerella sp.]